MHVNDWGSRFYLSAVWTVVQDLPRKLQNYMQLVQFGSLNATVKSVFRQTSRLILFEFMKISRNACKRLGESFLLICGIHQAAGVAAHRPNLQGTRAVWVAECNGEVRFSPNLMVVAAATLQHWQTFRKLGEMATRSSSNRFCGALS
jgi:hypothetical protein